MPERQSQRDGPDAEGMKVVIKLQGSSSYSSGLDPKKPLSCSQWSQKHFLFCICSWLFLALEKYSCQSRPYLFLQSFPHQQHGIEQWNNKISCCEDLDDWYFTGILLFQWHGAVQEASYLIPLPVLFRRPSFLLKKQKERTLVEEILQNTHDICPRSGTPLDISLKSKRRYVPGAMCLFHINQ